MKKVFILFSCFFQLQAQAGPYEVIRVLKDSMTFIAIELTEKTVFCTDKGYGNIQLKISVPDLDWLAHFDHRVESESEPCMAAGPCGDDLNPGKIIRSKEKLDIAAVRVILSESLWIDEDAKTCSSYLYENVSSYLRGFKFHHAAGDGGKSIDFEKCQKVIGL